MDEIMVDIIKRFLIEGYSITKVRKGAKFKRGIIIDSSTIAYMVGNERSIIRKKVFTSLKDIFPVEDEVIEEAMKGYLVETRKRKTTKRRPSQTSR